jgi:hypothetical protein
MLRWRRQKGSILGPAITLAYPVIFSLAVTATILSERLRAVVWGNGPQQDSTDSRIAQYKSGVPMVLTHPWGHGIGMSGLTLGVRNSQGQLTIDTYWLAIALDYGVIGFIIYYSMIFLSIYYAGLYTLTARKDDRDYGLLVPLGIALISFFVVKSVFAQEDNHPLIFMMMGVIVALVYRIKQETSRTVGTMKS